MKLEKDFREHFLQFLLEKSPLYHVDKSVKRHLSPGVLALIASVIAIIMVIFAFSEIRHSKTLIRDLTLDKGIAIINQVEQGLALALRANREVENELAERLLAAARTVTHENPAYVTHEKLKAIARDHDIKFLEIRDSKGHIVITVGAKASLATDSATDFTTMYADLVKGKLQEQVLGFHVQRMGRDTRFSVAVRNRSKGFVVAGIDAGQIIHFRKSFGLGRLLQDAGRQHDVHYLVIQDEDGIVAATEKIDRIESIESDPFLLRAWKSDQTEARMVSGDHDIFEVIKQIQIDQDVPALLRVAFDAKPLIAIEKKARRRMTVTLIVLAALLAVAINAVVIYQNLKVTRLSRDQAVSLSDAILKDMADGVIVIDQEGKIQMMNDRATFLLSGHLTPLPLPLENFAQSAFESDLPLLKEIELEDENGNTNLLVAMSKLQLDNSNPSMAVSILHDVTNERRMEKQARLNEKLIAMGNLAGAVAHEVRNPLNAIGMTAQRLQAEFSPEQDSDEYASLINIITEEIKRLDEIIGQFLQFAKSPAIESVQGSLANSIESVIQELAGLAESKSIRLSNHTESDFQWSFDPRQMRQVWLNLLTNAIDACNPGDSVSVNLYLENKIATIEIRDTGPGMDKATKERVFDLYYTTKDRGTGLGLPIALRIIHAHNGTLDLDSEINKGTQITIRFSKE